MTVISSCKLLFLTSRARCLIVMVLKFILKADLLFLRLSFYSSNTTYGLENCKPQTAFGIKKGFHLKRKKTLQYGGGKFSDNIFRNYTAEPKCPSMKVTICGASGNIGQPLSLMLKQCPYIDELNLFDITGACGVGLELSHVDTKCKVRAYTGKEQVKESLKNTRIVILAAGVSKYVGTTKDEFFAANAKIAMELAAACGEACPEALIAVVTNPLNSIVPVVCDVLKRWGRFDPNRVFGVTTLDCVRANMFVAEVLGLEPECVVVPVICGNSDSTIVPVLSQARPTKEFKPEEITQITQAIQQAGNEVIKAKEGLGAATLSTAFAAARFTISLVKGLIGHRGVVECTYVPTDCMEGVNYFAVPIELGPNGLMRNLGVPNLSEYECGLLQHAIPHLQNDIKRGEEFVRVQKNTEMLVC